MAQADMVGREQSERPATEKVRETFASLGSTAEEKMKEFVTVSREKLEQIRKKSLEDLYRDTKAYVRDNPGKTLLGAVAVGFILGKILRRR